MPYWKRPRLSPRSARSTSRFCLIGGSPPTCSPLPGQIQIAADFAKGTTARLAGAEVPSYADDEASFAALRQRIAKTVNFVQTFKPADIDGSETGTSRSSCEEVRFKGQPYLLHFALPNFYFHAATAYDLLRACGLGIGKRDFLGQI
jgi:uncharacterized protein